MTSDVVEGSVLVQLPKSLIASLLDVHASFDAQLAAAMQRLLKTHTDRPAECHSGPSPEARSTPPIRKYAAEFLGVRLTAWTLPEMFATIVDVTAEVAPEALDELAAMRARRRRFVARRPEAIHPGRLDLSVMPTASGWWISKNIGQDDLTRGLRALAQAAGLSYGKDLRFLAPEY